MCVCSVANGQSGLTQLAHRQGTGVRALDWPMAHFCIVSPVFCLTLFFHARSCTGTSMECGAEDLLIYFCVNAHEFHTESAWLHMKPSLFSALPCNSMLDKHSPPPVWLAAQFKCLHTSHNTITRQHAHTRIGIIKVTARAHTHTHTHTQAHVHMTHVGKQRTVT